MSINVTVSGNPIKIHRGKLITTDLQDADKRRKIRLQQVRQQSKEFAASVRNNVKKVKNKQQTDFEKQNQAKLKEWQNKKLLQLQNVYEDNVKNIGIGHAQAQVDEIEEIQEIERQKIINHEMASKRGRAAQELLQVKKNEENLQKAIPHQARQFAREVENARSAMIVTQAIHKTPKKKKVTKGNFTIVEHDIEEVPDQEDIDEIHSEPKYSSMKSNASIVVTNLPIKEVEQNGSRDDKIESAQIVTSNQSYERTETISGASPMKRFRNEDTSRISMVSVAVPPESRISDRIRSRHLISTRMRNIPDGGDKENAGSAKCSKALSTTTQAVVSIPPAINSNIITCPICVKQVNPLANACREHNQAGCANVVKNVCVPHLQICTHAGVDQSSQQFEIPSKPTVSVTRESYRPQYSNEDANPRREYRRVRSYDHNNRFGHHYIADTSNVHRIHANELEYCDNSDLESPSHVNTREFTKIADHRAKIAALRGKKALEKQNIRKDYEHLMKKLPILQKQGRIANLSPTNDKLHMSDARRVDHEKERQQKIERAFERLAPTTTITLPSTDSSKAKSPPRRKSPMRKAPETMKSSQKTVATWKSSTTDAATNVDTSETGNLISLLEKLRNQKEELLKECKDLPADSNFYKLIEDLDFVARTTSSNKDKQIQTQAGAAVQTRKSPPNSERKVHNQVLRLQNTSTQTSPKIGTVPATGTSPASSDSAEPPMKQSKPAYDSHKGSNAVCSCKNRDKLCEILIKIRDCPAHSVERMRSDENVREEDEKHSKRLEASLNLETSKFSKKAHAKSDDSEKSISPKRSRSESPKKAPRKIENVNRGTRKTSNRDFNNSEAGQSSRQSVVDTWKHHLSSSSRNPDEITSSTSYYSPPDYNLKDDGKGQNTCEPSGGEIPGPCDRSQGVPFDNRLLTYINKMLEVSKGRLNLLAGNVSSISDVPTPTSSIINIQSNRPQHVSGKRSHNESTQIEKLSTLLRYFNLTPGDFHSFVSVASVPSVSGTRSTSPGSSSVQSCGDDKYRASQRIAVSSTLLSQENYTQTHSPLMEPVVDQFTQWSEVCQARINNLTAMIEKVRMERREITSPKKSNVDSVNKSNNATSYMKLPATSNSSSPHSPSVEQRELDEQLLQVPDLTKTQGTNTRSTDDLQQLSMLSKTCHDLDKDIVERYMKLVGVELHAQRSKSPEPVVATPKSPPKSLPFKPLLDIPKLPKFQTKPTASTGVSSTHVKPRKPPVTNNALRFNDVIHELSAIPEAENSRLSKSPRARKSASPQKRTGGSRHPTRTQTSVAGKIRSSPTDVSTESPASEKSNESVESMLKNIGLDWAVKNLKIMNAANNNSSSSTSSFDVKLKKCAHLSKNVSISTERANNTNQNLSTQRTSTPVQTNNSSKSQVSHKLINSAESELSPVGSEVGRSNKSPCGCDAIQQTFHTLPSQSINADSNTL